MADQTAPLQTAKKTNVNVREFSPIRSRGSAAQVLEQRLPSVSREKLNAGLLTPHEIRSLHRTIGNQTMARLLAGVGQRRDGGAPQPSPVGGGRSGLLQRQVESTDVAPQPSVTAQAKPAAAAPATAGEPQANVTEAPAAASVTTTPAAAPSGVQAASAPRAAQTSAAAVPAEGKAGGQSAAGSPANASAQPSGTVSQGGGGSDAAAALGGLAAAAETMSLAEISAGVSRVRGIAESFLAQSRGSLSKNPPQMARPVGSPRSAKGAGAKPASAATGKTQVKQAAATGAKGATAAAQEPVKLPPASAPVMAVAAPAVLGDAQGKVSGADASKVEAAVDKLPVSDPGLNVPAPAAPTIALDGDADPAQAHRQLDELGKSADEAVASGRSDATQSAGEEDIFPDVAEGEVLKAEAGGLGAAGSPASAGAPTPAAATKAQSGGSAAGGAGSGVSGGAAAGGRDPAAALARQKWAERTRPALQQAQAQMAAAHGGHDQQTATTRAQSAAAIAQLITANAAQQTAAREQAQQGVTTARLEWMNAQLKETTAARTEAGQVTEGGDREIQAARTTAEDQAATHIRAGVAEAQRAKLDAEHSAAQEREQARGQSQGLLGRIRSAVTDFFSSLKAKIQGFFERARQLVRNALQKAADFARTAIERGRQLIVSAIQRVSRALIDLGNRLLAAFPRLRDLYRRAMEAITRAAISLVNKLADTLKAVVQKALNALGRLLDSLLASLEQAMLRIVQTVENLLQQLMKPIVIELPDMVLLPAIPISGRQIFSGSTGDIVVVKGGIETSAGPIELRAFVRGDLAASFLGGKIGPVNVRKVKIVVDPFGGRYSGSGEIQADGDVSVGVTMEGVLGGTGVWADLFATLEGGVRASGTLGGTASASEAVELAYDNGSITFNDAFRLDFCLRGSLALDAVARVKVGIEQEEGGGGGDGPSCALPSAGKSAQGKASGLPASQPANFAPQPPGGGGGGGLPSLPVAPGLAPGGKTKSKTEEITVWEGTWNVKTWAASKCWNMQGNISAGEGAGGPGGGGSSGGGGASGTFALMAGKGSYSMHASDFPAEEVLPAMLAAAKVEGQETAAAKAHAKATGGGAAAAGRTPKPGRMISQIQRGDDHLGSKAVISSDPTKGVTAKEFEQVAMLGALNDFQAKKGPSKYVPLIHGGFSEQSKTIRTRTVPGGGLHDRRGDMNELRVCFDGHDKRPAICDDDRNREEVRLDVENKEGDHNLSCLK